MHIATPHHITKKTRESGMLNKKKMERASSPGSNPVEVRECIEEMLKQTLESHLKGSLEIDIGLSKQFCSTLLQNHSVSHPTDSLGVTISPLYYKRLASALYESIISGPSCGSSNNTSLFNKDNDSKQKDELNELILDKGSELASILKSINFELHVQEPYFTQLKDGVKTVEGRCAVGDYKCIRSGALILINKWLVLEVQEVHHYDSFLEMLEAESLTKVLPGVKTMEEGVQVYRKFYTEQKEKSNGVLGIRVVKSAVQPYICLGIILSCLSYRGIQNLLGLGHLQLPHNLT
ncbi:ASCH domain-containing protein [Cephalotus follicularis]|uniref:ASCH domain-containing protein n=1 Tax=Cephalotus follicularis TaxID=3775 RepID=A0A1Q3DDV8_CEPFO|nr:ASCH domain-containing protein [Cephalotus follicularis]